MELRYNRDRKFTYSYLKVEGLVIDGDGEGAVVLIVDAYDGCPQPDAASSHATCHLFL